MSPIQLLMDEHRLIEQVIDALFGCAASLPESDDEAKADLAAFVAFIRGFADAHHHGKEEDILFAAMAELGMPTDAGPLAVMLAEHVEGRGFAKTLADAAESEGALEAEARTQVVWAAKSYGNLLRAHIQKEDQVLYPMADQMLPDPVWQTVEKAFAEFEGDAANATRANDLRATAATLIARYPSPAG